ncbi:uncharacterized protein LOC113315817 [Papaver somniferum]|uniref:uncharacterized protein LOC113315817 n=1 Tax=Papaver somniferum TaxID=3469 RepID=UPI000E70076A|nr:uncharacterized protein LOC113315817 [Papaver somniferum]
MINATREEVQRLLVILLMFEVLTGLKLNLEKSSMTSIGAEEMVEELAMELGCKTDELPITYLGMPIGACKRSEAIWEVVIERMRKKLAPWKRKFLNKAGRVTLIKSSLESIATYFLPVYYLPVAVEKQLNSIMRKFLWGEDDENKKMSWISWKRICKVTESMGRSLWFGISKANEDFHEAVNIRVQNGRSIRALNAAESVDLLELKFDIRNVILTQDLEDEVDGACTTRALYAKFEEADEDWEFAQISHSRLAPPKVVFLIWAALHNSVPTRHMLHHRGVTFRLIGFLILSLEFAYKIGRYREFQQN